MILPQRHLGAAKEDVLSGSRLRVFLLDLDLADVARMLDDLRDVGLVASSQLTSDPLRQVYVATPRPELPEDPDGAGADRNAEGGEVGLDHAEGTVDRPEKEENDEHVVRIPESLVVRSSRLLVRCHHHAAERDQHDIPRPTRARRQVGHQPSVETQVVLAGDQPEVDPMGDRVDPGEEEDRPSRRDVEGDVLVELYDSVQRRLSSP